MAKGDNTQWISLPLKLDWTLSDSRQNLNDQLMHTYGADPTVSTSNYPLDLPLKQGLLNLLPIKMSQTDEISLRSRPTVARDTANFAKGAGTLTDPRGIFHIDNVGNNVNWIAEMWGQVLYVWTSADTYTTANLGSIDGPVGFTQGHQTDGTRYAVVSSTFETHIITNPAGVTTITEITDADLPDEVVPTPVYLDGYLFIASMRTDSITYGSRRIYNSGVGTPLTWAASTFVETEETGGMIVALAKHHKSVVALCTDHIEFFRNAGVAAPNSPLQRQVEFVQHIGCINRATVAVHGDDIYFAGIDRSGAVGIYRIKDYKVEKISNESVDVLVHYHGGDNRRFGLCFDWTIDRDKTLTDRDNFATGYIIVFYGEPYYCFSTNTGVARNSSTNQLGKAPVALLYSIGTSLWTEIAYSHEDTGSTITTVIGGWFPYGCATRLSQNFGSTTIDYVYQNPYGGADDQQIAFHHATSVTGEVLNADGGFSSTSPTTPLAIHWPLLDLGTPSWKALSGVSVSEGLNRTNTIDVLSSLHIVRWGSYLVSGSDGYFYNLSTGLTSVTQPFDEGIYTRRVPMGQFRRQWFQLQYILTSTPSAIDQVHLKITPNEET